MCNQKSTKHRVWLQIKIKTLNNQLYIGVASCWKYGKGFGFVGIKHLVCGSLLAIYDKYDEPTDNTLV